ncbi:MAG: hypothetical protein M1814_001134 [Vezdaea aestivalis]|nr:MAG: hypothetical protein M1814_001134 [Vezdaea aestivalis]
MSSPDLCTSRNVLMPSNRKNTEEHDRSKRQRTTVSPRTVLHEDRNLEQTLQPSDISVDSSPRPQLTRQNLSLLEGQSPRASEQAMDSFSATTSRDTESLPKKNLNPRSPFYLYELECRGAFFADGNDGDDDNDNHEIQMPDDAAEVRQVLAAPHSDQDAEKNGKEARTFRRLVAHCGSEASALSRITSKLLPDPERISCSSDRYCAENVSWSAPPYPSANSSNSNCGIAVPEADLTFGWTVSAFPSERKAATSFQYSSHLVKNKTTFFPYFTCEVKGESGSLRIARLQNLHNALAIASNYLELKRRVGTEDDFYGNVFTMTMEQTCETMQLSWYWARKEDGKVKVYGTYCDAWVIYDKDPQVFITARRTFFNAMKYLEQQSQSWILKDLQKLVRLIRPPLQVTPLSSNNKKSTGSRKRKSSNSSARSTALSSVSRRSSLVHMTVENEESEGVH